MKRKKREDRIERLRGVEREARTALIAVVALADVVHLNPSALAAHQLRPLDLSTFRENLQPTYLIRAFAEFESGLREAWKRYFSRRTNPRTRDLIEAIASLRTVPLTWLREVHEVREYRNALVHEREDLPQAIAVADAIQRLVRYFSRLPPDW